MSAFLKLDRCRDCKAEVAWEWVPPVNLAGRVLAGTGVWRSALTDGRCPKCADGHAQAVYRQARSEELRTRFVEMVGELPYREFTFERFRIHAANKQTFEQVKAFDPSRVNLYLWGNSAAGKTHLATAILRSWFGLGTGVFTTCARLIRKLRMRPPEEEQRILDECCSAFVLVLDDFSSRESTPFFRRVLSEVLDRRRYRGRGGLVVTSPESLDVYTRNSGDRATASRLRALCVERELRPSLNGSAWRPSGSTESPGSQ